MFSKKYVFETRRTRTIRYTKNVILMIILCIFFYTGTGIAFIMIARNENKFSDESLYKRAPDVIVIFTGAKGRIPFGLTKAKQYKQPNIFITGVYSKNSVDTLLEPMKLSGEIDTNLLEIDYLARNTVENAISTMRYLQQHKGHKRVLIVSHDYHLVRIRLVTNTILGEDFEFYFSGIESDFSELRNIKILYKEVYKFFRAAVFLLMWESGAEIH